MIKCFEKINVWHQSNTTPWGVFLFLLVGLMALIPVFLGFALAGLTPFLGPKSMNAAPAAPFCALSVSIVWLADDSFLSNDVAMSASLNSTDWISFFLSADLASNRSKVKATAPDPTVSVIFVPINATDKLPVAKPVLQCRIKQIEIMNKMRYVVGVILTSVYFNHIWTFLYYHGHGIRVKPTSFHCLRI